MNILSGGYNTLNSPGYPTATCTKVARCMCAYLISLLNFFYSNVIVGKPYTFKLEQLYFGVNIDILDGKTSLVLFCFFNEYYYVQTRSKPLNHSNLVIFNSKMLNYMEIKATQVS